MQYSLGMVMHSCREDQLFRSRFVDAHYQYVLSISSKAGILFFIEIVFLCMKINTLHYISYWSYLKYKGSKFAIF